MRPIPEYNGRRKDAWRGVVYLLHFDEALGWSQHYVGWSKPENFETRIETHRKGRGAALPRAVARAGIGMNVVRVWRDKTMYFERRLKKGDFGIKRSLCPVCAGKAEADMTPMHELRRAIKRRRERALRAKRSLQRLSA